MAASQHWPENSTEAQPSNSLSGGGKITEKTVTRAMLMRLDKEFELLQTILTVEAQ